MSSMCSSNLTSGFIDLATFDEQEKYLYGGSCAIAYFVRETRKSTWFTVVPVVLSKSSGTALFGQDWSVNISRAGDYLLHTWLRVTIPAVTLSSNNPHGPDGRLRWTRYFMHNLIRQICITFNDLTAAQLDNYHLDFWAAFTVPAGKRVGYNNMVGNVNSLTQPHAPGDTIPSLTLNLPIPLFYSRDSGLALPTAALPYNEMRLSFSFRDWTDLLIVDNFGAAAGTNPSRPASNADLTTPDPQLTNVQVWGEYAIVSNDERKRMGCAPRDILIEQVQTAPIQTFAPATNSTPSYDIRFSHSIKVLFFAVRNKTNTSEWSNYTTASPVPNLCNTATPGGDSITFIPKGSADPLANVSLIYENTSRLSAMGVDYYSLINPFYHAPVIAMETGYHMYSYSLDFFCIDPMGSTNFGKLNNVSIVPVASKCAIKAANGSGEHGSGMDYPQQFEFIVTAVNYNIVRVSGGALGNFFKRITAAENMRLPSKIQKLLAWTNSVISDVFNNTYIIA